MKSEIQAAFATASRPSVTDRQPLPTTRLVKRAARSAQR
jgi:hypothetical protein